MYFPWGAIMLAAACEARFQLVRNENGIAESLNTLIDIAKVAAQRLRERKVIDAGLYDGEGLYSAMFREEDRDTLISRFESIAASGQSTGFETTIFVREDDFVLWPKDKNPLTDLDERFYTVWHDTISDEDIPVELEPPGGVITAPIVSPCNAPGNVLAITYNGRVIQHPEDGGPPIDYSNQQNIVLCEQAFRGLPDHAPVDRRDPKTVLSEGLQKEFWHLNHHASIAFNLLHEMFHTREVGGANPDGTYKVRDWPYPREGEEESRESVYGLWACFDLAEERPEAPIQVADCQAILGLALYLQFPNKFEHFTWATGGVMVEPEDKKLDYTPVEAESEDED